MPNQFHRKIVVLSDLLLFLKAHVKFSYSFVGSVVFRLLTLHSSSLEVRLASSHHKAARPCLGTISTLCEGVLKDAVENFAGYHEKINSLKNSSFAPDVDERDS